MVARKMVSRLEDVCLAGLRDLVTRTCGRLVLVTRDDDLNVEEKQAVVAEAVARLRLHVWDKVVWYLQDKVVLHIVEGVEVALEDKKEAWTANTEMPQFSMEIWAILKVGDLLLHPSLQRLHLPQFPRMLRTTLLSNLAQFPRLRHLQLDWSPHSAPHLAPGGSLHAPLCRAVAAMPSLVSFSLKHDATDLVLEALVAGCGGTLARLDIEFSAQINDESVPWLLRLQNVTSLGVAKTKITAEGQAELLVKLPKLKHLLRGDFLCDALDWVAWERMYEDKPRLQLHIANFVASETYLFHTTDQMLLTAEMCPHIQDMLFLYQDRFTCDLLVLGRFQKLKQLELWGGDFYVDKMDDLFANIGARLEKLELHHVENIDERAVGVLSTQCSKLVQLGFSTCGFFEAELEGLGGGEEDELYLLQQMSRKRDNKNNLRPLRDVEVLSLDGNCPKNLIVTILSLCVNVRRLEVGTRTQICDDCFEEVFKTNKLKLLEVMRIKSNAELTLRTVSGLLFHCEQIKVISEVDCWTGVGKEELDELDEHMRNCNADIVFTSKRQPCRQSLSTDQIYQSIKIYHL